MSTNTEDPLDRLNYYNGQRLEAADLRVEQDYHIRVRRTLNKALYTAGIVDGLEVNEVEGSTHEVVVSPGVAFDHDGREIILLEATTVQVYGVPSTKETWVYGNYLTIEYDEETTSPASDGCTSGGGSKRACDHAWSGPTRIRATPKISMQDAWPTADSGKVILAQIELDETCAVAGIHTQPRTYVESADNSTRSFVLEGEKAIAKGNPKTLSFVIVGAPATSVTLYLWGEKFPTMFYTEIGSHSHEVLEHETRLDDLQDEDDRSTSHHHTIEIAELNKLKTENASPVDDTTFDLTVPAHREGGDDLSKAVAFSLDDAKDGTRTVVGQLKGTFENGQHSHTVSADAALETSSETSTAARHTHVVPKHDTEPTGQDIAVDPRSTAFTYLDDLRIELDGEPITNKVLSQLQPLPADWTKLGDGTDEHALCSGTGAIVLDAIGEFNEGMHTLEFRVTNDSGGTLRYLLRVE